MRKWVTSKGDSIHSNKNQHKPTVEKGKGLEPLWSVIFDATPLHFDTKLTGSFASLVKVELEKQAKKVATEKTMAPRRELGPSGSIPEYTSTAYQTSCTTLYAQTVAIAT